MHEQNNAELVTKMHIKKKLLLSSKSFYLFIFVEAGWLAKSINTDLSMRFFWNFRESNTEITSSRINYKIVACFEDLNKLRTWPSAFLRRPMF